MKINYVKWLLSYTKNAKKNFFLYVFIGLLMILVWLILPLLVAKETILLTNNSWKDLYSIALIIFAIHFFYAFLKYFISYNAQKFFTTTYKNLHLDISKNFLNTTYETILKRKPGYFIERMTNDTIDIADFFINITDNLIDIFIYIGSLITILILNPFIFLFYLYFLLLLFLIKKVKTKRYTEEEKRKRESVENLMTGNIEMIQGNKEIKVLGCKNLFLKKTETKLNHFNNCSLALGEVNRFFLFLTNNIQNVFRFLLISLSIYLISQNKITVSIAILAFNYESDIFSLLDNIEELLKNIRIFKLSANRILEILHTPKETYGKIQKTSPCKEIIMNQVSFSYQEEKEVLKNVNLKINANENTGIVGTSGSGKSTLFHLLTRIYEPKEGNIKINDRNLQELSEKELRNKITIVSQDPFLFQMSILENLTLGKSLTMDKIIEACKIAQIHEEIMHMPKQYETKIENNGTNLSGGQKQRLAIARALLQDTEILLLDEATSALDNITQEKIQIALKRKKKKKTIITIAHRLSTIIDSDTIFFLKNGTIEKQGTHKEQLKTNPDYKNLYLLETNTKKKKEM